MWRLTVEEKFSAAHQIPGHSGKCARLHGHNYLVRVAVGTTSLNELGFVLDISLVRTLLNRVVLEKFDHRYLNELEAFQKVIPSLENVAAHIYRELVVLLPSMASTHIKLLWVELSESSSAVVRYQPQKEG